MWTFWPQTINRKTFDHKRGSDIWPQSSMWHFTYIHPLSFYVSTTKYLLELSFHNQVWAYQNNMVGRVSQNVQTEYVIHVGHTIFYLFEPKALLRTKKIRISIHAFPSRQSFTTFFVLSNAFGPNNHKMAHRNFSVRTFTKMIWDTLMVGLVLWPRLRIKVWRLNTFTKLLLKYLQAYFKDQK